MRRGKSVASGMATLPGAILAVARARRTVRRFATSAGAALLMATVLPVAATLSPAGALVPAPYIPDLCADKTPPCLRRLAPRYRRSGPDAAAQTCLGRHIGDAGPCL